MSQPQLDLVRSAQPGGTSVVLYSSCLAVTITKKMWLGHGMEHLGTYLTTVIAKLSDSTR